MTHYSRLLAIDPSLTCSGWALFQVKGRELLAVGKIKAPPSSSGPLSTRLKALQNSVTALFNDHDLGQDCVLVCESATTMKDPKAVIILEQVRAIFEVLARQRGVSVPGRVHPRTVQREVMGLVGTQIAREAVKYAACSVVNNLYSEALRECGLKTSIDTLIKHQDIVDATLIGHLALSRISQWNNARELPLENFFYDSKKGLRSV